jgi:hypothetical protein
MERIVPSHFKISMTVTTSTQKKSNSAFCRISVEFDHIKFFLVESQNKHWDS